MILWPGLLFLAGYRKLALWSLATVAVAYALPLPLYGFTVYRQWLHALTADIHWMAPTNIALIPLFTRFGLHTVGCLMAAIVAALLGFWAWKNKPDFLPACGVGICAALLCAPLAWFDYLMFLSTFFVVRRWNRMATIAAFLLMVPRQFALAAGCSIYLASTLIILYTFLRIGDLQSSRVTDVSDVWGCITNPRSLNPDEAR